MNVCVHLCLTPHTFTLSKIFLDKTKIVSAHKSYHRSAEILII